VSIEVRIHVIELIAETCQAGARKHKACELLGISVRTLERWEKTDGAVDKRKQSARVPSNKLTVEERQVILETVNSPPYQNLPPCKIVPMLADDGYYIGSESTIYRVLRTENQLHHRQTTRSAKHHKPREYIAYKRNQVWTWDISYLPTQVRGLYFYLYMIVDIYSRKIVGWSVHEVESSEHAANLIKQACLDENVSQDQLVLHSDNGSSMKGITMLAMLEILGVIPSFSRPSVSDDNPYSEALFKTVKYHPTFPMIDKFCIIFDARIWCEKFVGWYNKQHLHSALKFVTPEQRHNGEDIVVRQKRHVVYGEAKKRHPERWTGNTRDWSLKDMVTLNPNKKLNLNKQENHNEFKLAA
jgi:putative transposase